LSSTEFDIGKVLEVGIMRVGESRVEESNLWDRTHVYSFSARR
jgi:hypothetical protein